MRKSSVNAAVARSLVASTSISISSRPSRKNLGSSSPKPMTQSWVPSERSTQLPLSDQISLAPVSPDLSRCLRDFTYLSRSPDLSLFLAIVTSGHSSSLSQSLPTSITGLSRARVCTGSAFEGSDPGSRRGFGESGKLEPQVASGLESVFSNLLSPPYCTVHFFPLRLRAPSLSLGRCQERASGERS